MVFRREWEPERYPYRLKWGISVRQTRWLEFHGVKVTSAIGLLALREPDEMLGLKEGNRANPVWFTDR